MTEFKKGDKVIVIDNRKGTYKGTVEKDFDTVTDEWYSISLRQEYLEGMSTYWEKGDHVPCRRGLAIVRLDTSEYSS